MLILTTFEGGLWCSNLEIPAYIVGLKRITRESGTKHTISSFFKWAGDVNGNARPLCFISKTGSDSVSEFGSNLMASKNFCRENHESGMNKKYIKEKGQNCWLRENNFMGLDQNKDLFTEEFTYHCRHLLLHNIIRQSMEIEMTSNPVCI